MRFCCRYKVYEEILKYKSTEILDDIASYAKLKTEIVINDLKKAVKRKYIPQGHFGKDEIIFMVSDETFAKYQEKQDVYDRYYRKQVEERARMKERSKAMQEIMNSGQRYIDKIHECNDIIKDKKISEKFFGFLKQNRLVNRLYSRTVKTGKRETRPRPAAGKEPSDGSNKNRRTAPLAHLGGHRTPHRILP